MASRYYIEASINCVFIQHFDEIVVGRVGPSMSEVFEDSHYCVGMNFLHDATQSTFTENIDTNAIIERRRLNRNIIDPQIGTCRIAWVVGSRTDYGLMHRFAVYNRSNKVERKPFRETEKARIWLDIPEGYEIKHPTPEKLVSY